MNWEGCERERSWPNRGTLDTFARRDWGKSLKVLELANIQPRYEPSTRACLCICLVMPCMYSILIQNFYQLFFISNIRSEFVYRVLLVLLLIAPLMSLSWLFNHKGIHFHALAVLHSCIPNLHIVTRNPYVCMLHSSRTMQLQMTTPSPTPSRLTRTIVLEEKTTNCYFHHPGR